MDFHLFYFCIFLKDSLILMDFKTSQVHLMTKVTPLQNFLQMFESN